MKYAHKLNIEFPVPKDEDREYLSGHGRLKKSTKYNLNRWDFNSDEELDSYLELVAPLKPYLRTASVTKIRLLAHHVHVWDKSIINFYYQTNGEVTTFWEGKIERDDRWSQDNGNGYINVNPDLLKPAQRYVAAPGDVWLIDAMQPHSVFPNVETESNTANWLKNRQLIKHTRENERKLVQLIFTIPPKKALRKLGYEPEI